MVWTNPKTVNAGETALADDWNTYVRDNTNWLGKPPICKALRTTDTNVSTGAGWVDLDLQSTEFETQAMRVGARIHLPEDGIYHVLISADAESNDLGHFILRCMGSTLLEISRFYTQVEGSNWNKQHGIGTYINASTGEQLYLQAQTSTPSDPLTVYTARLEVARVSLAP